MSNSNHQYPNTELATLEGTVTVSALRHPTAKVEHDEVPAQVIIAELCPEIYGIVLRKCRPDPAIISSFVIDENLKFGCQEQSRTVDLEVRDEKNDGLVSEFRLAFTDELDWLECVRLLEQAKSRHVLCKLRIRENLKLAEAQDFGPEH
ncbi:hypothetical protein C8T65DRAFT_736257 [Cerioporus squamosus]|nr:hypothetical protein C8T65DRAFT_736257 [Cerioporus squamosus]